MSEVPTFGGRCHCGALSVQFRTRVAPEAIQVRACQCGFCRRHQSRAVSDPEGGIAFFEHDPGAALRYRFGLRTADYLICARCGVYMGAAVVEGDAGVALVNTPALDAQTRFDRAAEPMVYDQEDAAARLSRRRATWTPLLVALPGAEPLG